jgi:hypothetical protein
MHWAQGAGVYQLSSPSVREITRDAQGATLVDLMNTTGCTVWQTERPRDPIHVHPHSGQSVVDYLMGPASFLKFTTVALHRGR